MAYFDPRRDKQNIGSHRVVFGQKMIDCRDFLTNFGSKKAQVAIFEQAERQPNIRRGYVHLIRPERNRTLTLEGCVFGQMLVNSREDIEDSGAKESPVMLSKQRETDQT
jgi:hypothetical protein